MLKREVSKDRDSAFDAFSGCGGLTLGLKQAGFKVVGAVEIDPLAVETYKANHPEVYVWRRDIRELSGSEILEKLKLCQGDLDLLAGCPPCQGFSSIRTLRGHKQIEDDRNNLIFDFLRLVEELSPRAIMMENVPGLAKDSRMGNFLEKIRRLGYEADNVVNILNTADYHVPQRRYRMILLTSRFGMIPYAKPSKRRLTVRSAIASLPPPGQSGDPLHDLPEKRTGRVRAMISEIPKDGGSRTDLNRKYCLKCHKDFVGFKDVYGRISWDDVAPTMTGGCTNPSKGRFIHPDKDRAITVREAALLQSFPPKYFFSLKGGKQGASTMIGNALPPEFAKRHALQIKKYLDGNHENRRRK